MSVPAPPRPRVAVIDDEPDVSTFLQLALEDAGFDVLVSNTPVSVLQGLRAFAPHVICLDVVMPERLGPSLLTDIRRTEELREVPVVILSGLPDGARTLDGLDSGGGGPPPAAFLEKPIDAAALVLTVRRLLAGGSRARP